MVAVKAFAPAHISGFFEPFWDRDPRLAGSRNCGPCLNSGVTTEVEVRPSGRTRLNIKIDGRKHPAETTRAVIRQLLGLTRENFEIRVDHRCDVPVGAGFGASGAGALGTALALSKALGLRLPRDELVAAAHVAEISNRTGLGDVVAQAVGGLVIGVRAGAPPRGERRRIPVPNDLKVVCCTLGPLHTSGLLREEGFRRHAKTLGSEAMKKLLRHPTPKNFMRVSGEFSEKLGLLDDELRILIRAAEDAGAIGASQVMLGRAVFALVPSKRVGAVERAFIEFVGPGAVLTSGISKVDGKIL